MMELEKQIAYHQQMEETTMKVSGYLEIIIDADAYMPGFFLGLSLHVLSFWLFYLQILGCVFHSHNTRRSMEQ